MVPGGPASLRRGSSENNLELDQPDGPCPGGAAAEIVRSRSCLDSLQQKMLMVTEQLKIEQTARDENLAEYLKLMNSADKQQVGRIKQVFEKKNQKSAQSIAQMQKKLEQYHRKMKDSEIFVPTAGQHPAFSSPANAYHSSSGKHSTIPRESPKELLRDVTGSGRHPTMDKIKTIGPGVSLSPPFFFSKPREFANLIRNKFGSADNISHLKTSMDTTSSSFPSGAGGGGGNGADKGLCNSTSMVAKTKYTSDDECSSGSASVSADSNGNLLGAGGVSSGAGQAQDAAGGGAGRLATTLEEEEEEDKEKPKTKKVEKTVWDWELMNDIKPIWQRQAKEVEEEEYKAFYKTFSKDTDEPLSHIHFTAEGEVTFKSILFVPASAPRGMFDEYGSKKNDYIKLFVRRVFITDDFNDMMPKYLNFVKGVVDSDDLPLNVSRETLQQHKLLKVIRKKLVRKTLDMIKKIAEEHYNDKFWKEFGTNIKLGVIEDHSNRTRLAKLLRFFTSHSDTEVSSLEQYVERMKEKQDKIYFMAGTNRKESESSPFVERLLKKGYEVVYLTEPVDEYCIQALPEFDGKRFQNVAKEGIKFDESEKAKGKREELEKDFEPLTTWLKEKSLKDKIEKAIISQRLTSSPCALVASQYGWSGNMERIMKAQAYQTGKDISTNYYASQKKTLEINPKHPLIKQMLKKVHENADDQTASDLAVVLFETATLRSGYQLADTKAYGDRIERMLRLSMNVDLDEQIEEEPEEEPEEAAEEEAEEEEDEIADDDDDSATTEKDEL
uniref:Endoplasmin-like n=1 Tax=Gadus morhua TaxID=8049 RepID=A0A8C5CFQ0_GADMO